MLAVALVGSIRQAETSPDVAREVEALVEGAVFSVDQGDPIDVEFARFPGYGCIHISGSFLPSGTSCFDAETPSASTYVIAIPVVPDESAFVIGVMPTGSEGAAVRVSGDDVPAATRGRWFLAQLEPGALGPNNTNPVDVEFQR